MASNTCRKVHPHPPSPLSQFPPPPPPSPTVQYLQWGQHLTHTHTYTVFTFLGLKSYILWERDREREEQEVGWGGFWCWVDTGTFFHTQKLGMANFSGFCATWSHYKISTCGRLALSLSIVQYAMGSMGDFLTKVWIMKAVNFIGDTSSTDFLITTPSWSPVGYNRVEAAVMLLLIT